MTEKRSPSKLIWILTVIAVASLLGCAGKPTPPSDLFVSQPEAKAQDAQAAVTGPVQAPPSDGEFCTSLIMKFACCWRSSLETEPKCKL